MRCVIKGSWSPGIRSYRDSTGGGGERLLDAKSSRLPLGEDRNVGINIKHVELILPVLAKESNSFFFGPIRE